MGERRVGAVGTPVADRRSAIALPAGQASYLFFQQWRVLDYDGGTRFYDAGTVEINGAATRRAALGERTGQTIFTGPATRPGQKGFGGDSRGYLASRLDLSRSPGTRSRRSSRMSTDATSSALGWFVDDIQVYTCDVAVGKVRRSRASSSSATR